MPCFSTRRIAACTLLAVGLGAAFGAGAQAPAAPLSDAERAKRDAEKVFQWIRIHADKPRKAAAPPAPEKPPVVQAARAPRPPARTEKSPEAPADPAPRPATAPEAAVAIAPLAAAPSATVAPAVDASAPLAAAPVPEVEEVALTPLVKTEPQFPGHLMRQLRKGLVQVAFTVQPDGSVAQVQAVSSTHPRLAPVALATVAQWRFQPVRQSQQAVVDLGFNLD